MDTVPPSIRYRASSRWFFNRSESVRRPKVVLIDDGALDSVDLSTRKARKAFRKKLKEDLKTDPGSPFAAVLNQSGRLRWWDIRARIDIGRLMNPKNQREIQESTHPKLWSFLQKLLPTRFRKETVDAARRAAEAARQWEIRAQQLDAAAMALGTASRVDVLAAGQKPPE